MKKNFMRTFTNNYYTIGCVFFPFFNRQNISLRLSSSRAWLWYSTSFLDIFFTCVVPPSSTLSSFFFDHPYSLFFLISHFKSSPCCCSQLHFTSCCYISCFNDFIIDLRLWMTKFFTIFQVWKLWKWKVNACFPLIANFTIIFGWRTKQNEQIYLLFFIKINEDVWSEGENSQRKKKGLKMEFFYEFWFLIFLTLFSVCCKVIEIHLRVLQKTLLRVKRKVESTINNYQLFISALLIPSIKTHKFQEKWFQTD